MTFFWGFVSGVAATTFISCVLIWLFRKPETEDEDDDEFSTSYPSHEDTGEDDDDAED
jgi:hypothetical protein